MEKLSPSQEFMETMGMEFQNEGLPRIAGRLYGLLLLEGGPFSFSELAERLEVSRASVSTNARMLATQGLIERVAVPGDRQDHYAIDAKGLIHMHRREIDKLQELCGWFEEAAVTLGDHAKGTRERLMTSAILWGAALEGWRSALEKAQAQIEDLNAKT